jgi:hypothetical protein
MRHRLQDIRGLYESTSVIDHACSFGIIVLRAIAPHYSHVLRTEFPTDHTASSTPSNPLASALSPAYPAAHVLGALSPRTSGAAERHRKRVRRCSRPVRRRGRRPRSQCARGGPSAECAPSRSSIRGRGGRRRGLRGDRKTAEASRRFRLIRLRLVFAQRAPAGRSYMLLLPAQGKERSRTARQATMPSDEKWSSPMSCWRRHPSSALDSRMLLLVRRSFPPSPFHPAPIFTL